MGFIGLSVLFGFCVLGAAHLLGVRGWFVTGVAWALAAALYLAPAEFQAGLLAWADYEAARLSDSLIHVLEATLTSAFESAPSSP